MGTLLLEPFTRRARLELLFCLAGIPLGLCVLVVPYWGFGFALAVMLLTPGYESTWVAGVAAILGLLLLVVLATRIARGLGGVHRGWASTADISADLGELARTEALVVASGVKSLLDVSATAELLETIGIPVLGWRTDEVPLFYRREGGPPVSACVQTAEEAARIAQYHWRLGRHSALLVARPPEESLDVETLVDDAVTEAEQQGVAGQDITPFVLAYLHEASGGATREANRSIVVENAGLAGEIAVAYSQLD